MQATEHVYAGVLAQITKLLVPNGLLESSPDTALGLDRVHLRLTSWRHDLGLLINSRAYEEHDVVHDKDRRQMDETLRSIQWLIQSLEGSARIRNARSASIEARDSSNPTSADTSKPVGCTHNWEIIKSDTTLILWRCDLCRSGPHWWIYSCTGCQAKSCKSCLAKWDNIEQGTSTKAAQKGRVSDAYILHQVEHRIEDILFKLNLEIDKLDKTESRLESHLAPPSPQSSESAVSDGEGGDVSSVESDFDVSWRPHGHDEPDVTQLLLDAGKTDLISEALRAASLGHPKTMSLLLSRIQPDDLESCTDRSGRTILQVANLGGHEDLAKMIRGKISTSSNSDALLVHSQDAIVARPEEMPLSALSDSTPLLQLLAPSETDSEKFSRLVESTVNLVGALSDLLYDLREEESRNSPRILVEITGTIEKLYHLSGIYKQLRAAFNAPPYTYSLYRIKRDTALVVNSTLLTLVVAQGVLDRANSAALWLVWHDLRHRFQDVERVPLTTRFEWYHSFVEGLLGHLQGNTLDATHVRTRASIQELFKNQQAQSPRAHCYGRTPLHVALLGGEFEVVRDLRMEATAVSNIRALALRPRSPHLDATRESTSSTLAHVSQLSRLAQSALEVVLPLRRASERSPLGLIAGRTGILGAIEDLHSMRTALRQLKEMLGSQFFVDNRERVDMSIDLVHRSAMDTIYVTQDILLYPDIVLQRMAWNELDPILEGMEQMSLSDRLKWYRDLVESLLDQPNGEQFTMKWLQAETRVQNLSRRQRQRDQDLEAEQDVEASTTAPSTRMSQTHGYGYAPSETLRDDVSSLSSFSSEADEETPISWTSYIFGGEKWRSHYRTSQQLEATTRCKGTVQPAAKLALQQEGFVPLESIHFSDNGSILTFYWRPQNGRARLLFTSNTTRGKELYYCLPLTRLLAFRDGSLLKLCMASRSDEDLFLTWAELKFTHHERMVLFYSTFVALKRQDPAGLHRALIDDPRDMEEEGLFGGIVRDRDMLHGLRLLQDRGSGVIRLEARPYRGDKDGVPIWTAFLTKYKEGRDIDFFALEGRGLVSMACPRPKPFIFVSKYALPLTSDGEIALQFVERNDAADFVRVWTRLCEHI